MANQTVYPYGTGGSLPSSIGIVNDLKTGGADKALSAEQGKFLGGVVDDLYGFEREFEESVDFSEETLYNISMDSDKLYVYDTTKTYKAYRIPIPEEADQFVITPNNSTNIPIFISKSIVPPGTYNGSTVVSDYMSTGCDGYAPTSPSAYRMTVLRSEGAATIKLSGNAKYLYIQKNYGDTSINCTPSALVFSGTVRGDGKLDDIAQMSIGAYDGISFQKGYVDDNGEIQPDTTHVVSNLIPTSSGYFLWVNSPKFKIKRVALYDGRGVCVNTKYFTYISGGVANKATHFGRMSGETGYYVRFVIEKQTGDIMPDDKIVVKFALFNDPRLKRVFPENSKFQLYHERLKALTNVTWKALSYVPSPRVYGDTYFGANSVNIGIPYSELAEYSKYVGIDVSLRTYLTALMNPRSVMYTENASSEASSSKYGLVYHNYEDAAGAYYGTVCSGLTAYALGLPQIVTSALYGSGFISGETKIAKGDANNKYYIRDNGNWVVCTAHDVVDLVQPMDVIVSPGHVSTISDIYTDEYGNRQFIVWCEEGRIEVCVSKQRPLPIAAFISKLDGYSSQENGWTLLRYTNWDDLTPVQDDRDSVPMNWFDAPADLSIDPDICTYAGDYVVFQIGDASDTLNNNKAFLNIHRNKGVYDTLQIFAESANVSTDSPVATVDISSNSDTYIYNSTSIFADDASDKDDWIVVDLKQLPTALTHGKYKARVIKDGGDAVSGFTHFQMVDVNFTITGTSISDMVCSYSSEEGVPYYMRRERRDGMGADTRQRSIPEGETSSTAARTWGFSSTIRYLKVFFKADYGTAVKRIDVYGMFNS